MIRQQNTDFTLGYTTFICSALHGKNADSRVLMIRLVWHYLYTQYCLCTGFHNFHRHCMARFQSVDDKTCVTLLFCTILSVHWGTKLSHVVHSKNANCRVLMIRHVWHHFSTQYFSLQYCVCSCNRVHNFHRVLMIRLVWHYCRDYCSLLLLGPAHLNHDGDEDEFGIQLQNILRKVV